MSPAAVVVRHNFETAHRLPQLGGKCFNLHGHSWWVTLTVAADELTDHDTVADFGSLKTALRGWIDTHLDHGVMLGATDPLWAPLAEAGCKVYPFGVESPVGEQVHARGLWWPTVENVAHLLGRVANVIVGNLVAVAATARVTQVMVQETHVNAATWAPTP